MYPETTKLQTPNHQAKDCMDRSDNCTASFFMPYKTKAKQNWVNEIKIGKFSETSETEWQGKSRGTSGVSEGFATY